MQVKRKVIEGGKERLQIIEGIVIARKHKNEPGATITVRKIASGVGVEFIFPLGSPLIESIEILKRSKVRRAKLYYMRKRSGMTLEVKARENAGVTEDLKAAEADKKVKEVKKPKKEEEEKAGRFKNEQLKKQKSKKKDKKQKGGNK